MPKEDTMTTSHNKIRLCDLNRAALLLCQGILLIDAEPNKANNLEFVFDNSDDKAMLASAALMENRPVPIRDFLDACRRLREMIFQHRLITRGRNNRRGPEIL
jgi:Domain of unknown function (DUF5659)